MRYRDIPAPPKACEKNGVLYTSYVGVVYSGSSNNIIDYRYIFRNNPSVECYSVGGVFIGPTANGGSVPIGCDIFNSIPSSYNQTRHNDSYYNYTLDCPLDQNSWMLLIGCSIISVFFILKKKIA